MHVAVPIFVNFVALNLIEISKPSDDDDDGDDVR